MQPGTFLVGRNWLVTFTYVDMTMQPVYPAPLTKANRDTSYPFRPVRPGDAEEKGKHILTIFDLQNKFIAYTAPVRSIMALV
jgi:hypothetical protein